ncbi:MAG: glycogen/starch synthase [Candidatus Bostrichicola ureolyticus]|nr:MAG: glycogen/starch synthase [Candidatus Bostrichicola ureolyticus]
MKGKSILYISSDIFPYSNHNSISKTTLKVSKLMHSCGNDVRIFIPRFGIINERRHQLHEVIRLSGSTLVIDNIEQPLLIKVATIPSERLQVYFIDNEEYFKRKAIYEDEKGNLFKDNDERTLFFTKGVLETVKKLNWIPDVIHIYGWISSLIPLYVKLYYKNHVIYKKVKILASIFNNYFKGNLNNNLIKKIKNDGINFLKYIKKNPNYINLTKLCIYFSDYIIKEDEILLPEIENFIQRKKNKIKLFSSKIEDISSIYNKILK